MKQIAKINTYIYIYIHTHIRALSLSSKYSSVTFIMYIKFAVKMLLRTIALLLFYSILQSLVRLWSIIFKFQLLQASFLDSIEPQRLDVWFHSRCISWKRIITSLKNYTTIYVLPKDSDMALFFPLIIVWMIDPIIKIELLLSKYNNIIPAPFIWFFLFFFEGILSYGIWSY